MEETIVRRRGSAQELVKPQMSLEDWKHAAQTDQIQVMQAAERWLEEPFAEEILGLVTRREPLLIFQQFSDIRSKLPHTEAWLQAAAERASEIDPGIVFFYFPLIQDKSYAGTVLTRAAEGCIRLKRVNALEFADKYLSRPEAESILTRAAEEFPTQAIYFFQKYQSHPSAQTILRDAVERDPKAAILHANRYAEAQDAKQLLKQAITKEPKTAENYRQRYAAFLE